MKPALALRVSNAVHGNMSKLKRERILSWQFLGGVLALAFLLGACVTIPGFIQ